MANLLQSSQVQATQAPSFYTDYLSNLVNRGIAAQQGAQYVGAQPLQTQAFQKAGESVGAFQPTLTQAGGYLSSAAGMNLGDVAQSYMNPYIRSAVQGMSDIAQRNIQQNLSPAATAAAVGTGQYGSQRGTQVLGQVQRQAEQDLNAEIAKMMTSGYGQALQAAGQQQAGMTQAGAQLGQLGTSQQAMNLADINALSTLGGQQQQIAQNAYNYPLSTLQQLSNVLQGATVPTTTTTTLNMSPFSALGAVGTGVLGMMQPTRFDPKTGLPIPGSAPLAGIMDLIKGRGNTTPTPDWGIGSTVMGGTTGDVQAGGDFNYGDIPNYYGTMLGEEFAEGGLTSTDDNDEDGTL